ncbi:MAG: Crp/Fnr family transcriptional regulator [Cyanobacteria bacterium J06623_4]
MPLHFKRNEYLPTDRNQLLHIQSGYVRTCTLTWEGEIVTLGFWSVGSVIGQRLAQMESFQAQCLSEVVVDLLGDDYVISQAQIFAHSRQLTDLIKINHCREVKLRLLQFFCWLAMRFGEQDANSHLYKIPMNLTQTEIAESIGITRVTVARLLKKLESDGMAKWTPREKWLSPVAFQRVPQMLPSINKPNS